MIPDHQAEALRRLHAPPIQVALPMQVTCRNCGELWPCSTIRVLDGLETP